MALLRQNFVIVDGKHQLQGRLPAVMLRGRRIRIVGSGNNVFACIGIGEENLPSFDCACRDRLLPGNCIRLTRVIIGHTVEIGFIQTPIFIFITNYGKLASTAEGKCL